MKKTAALALCLILVILLIGCKKKQNRDNRAANERDYQITYELGNLADLLIDAPASAKYSDTVEIRTQVLCDADIHVYVDGVEIEKSHYDSDYWGYSFAMPKNDVIITAKPYTKSEIWGTD